VFGITYAKATRQENINNKPHRRQQTNSTDPANKQLQKCPRIVANAKRYICIFGHALCSYPFHFPKKKIRSVLLCESKNYLQQTLETDLPRPKNPKKKTSFVKIIDCALVLVLV